MNEETPIWDSTLSQPKQVSQAAGWRPGPRPTPKPDRPWLQARLASGKSVPSPALSTSPILKSDDQPFWFVRDSAVSAL